MYNITGVGTRELKFDTYSYLHDDYFIEQHSSF